MRVTSLEKKGKTKGPVADYDVEPMTIVRGNLRHTDCLLGRGNNIANFVGNIQFRRIIWEYRDVYMKAARCVKFKVAETVVEKIASLDPPGRFLRLIEEGVYEEVSKKKAIEKVCQALREKKLTGPPPKVEMDKLILSGSTKRSLKVVTPKEIVMMAATPEENTSRRRKSKASVSKKTITPDQNQDASENEPKQVFQTPRNSAWIKAKDSKNTEKMEGLHLFVKENKAVSVKSPQKFSTWTDPKKPLTQLKPKPRKVVSVHSTVQSQLTKTSKGFATESSPNCNFRMIPTAIPEFLLGNINSVARKLDFDQPSIKAKSNIPGSETSSSPLGNVLFPSSLMIRSPEKSFVRSASMLDNNVSIMDLFSSYLIDENHGAASQHQNAYPEIFQPFFAETIHQLTLMPPHLSSFFSSGMISVTSASNHSELAADDWDLPSVGGDIMDQNWAAGESWNGHFRVSPETNPATACGVNEVLPKPRLEPMDWLLLDDDLFAVEDLDHLDVKEARENLVETPTLFM